jgi:geranyl-CoA carboxylase alpha subunit
MAAFGKILIANRGEIALRIARTARAMGYRTVVVYSDADRDMPHVAFVDEAIPVGAAPAAESYLSIEKIVASAKRAGADAIHPGYGFLSENADFAEACAAAHLVFIGPPAAAIRLMGNKAAAKRRMIEGGVPCVPGYDGKDQSDDAFTRTAAKIGYPVMVKAAAGGGGRGMRLVTEAARLSEGLRAARAEASKAFGSDELILEKALAHARHVEIQVFGDRHGNVVHLGERDCSIQRRHQKVIEEALCPALSPALRCAMGEAAVAACKAVDYVSAGTVEFLLTPENEFYFLEMNTRLQVEHPVTEMITGLDLVEWQLRVAAGEALPLKQEMIAFHGHAIEARLCAEDPARDFLPAAGKLLAWEPPAGNGIRVDHGLAPGVVVSPYYDSMLAKIVAHGATREEARRRLVAALNDTVALGISTNRDFLVDCLSHPVFVAGEANTGFIEKHFSALKPPKTDIRMVALAAALMAERTRYDEIPMLCNWRSNGVSSTFVLVGCGGERIAAEIFARGDRAFDVKCAGESHAIEIRGEEGARLRFLSSGVEQTAQFAWGDGVLHLSAFGRTAAFEDVQITAASAAIGGGDAALAPMAGRISAIRVKLGDEVGKGECLIVLEAMKMEHEVAAPRQGRIAAILVKAGEQVTTRARLVELMPLN